MGNKDFKIFLDMDGVVTNFEGSFININSNEKNENWDTFVEKYGRDKAWSIVDENGIEWWSNMPWIEDGKQLWDFVKDFDPTILSRPSRSKESSLGKFEWCKRELHIIQENYTTSAKLKKWSEQSRIILTSNKELFATRYENSILIDDTKRNIEKWEEVGGIGILHKSTKQTIEQLNRILNDIKG